MRLATLGRWAEAEPDLRKLRDLPAAKTLPPQGLGLLALALGDDAGYRKVCATAWGVGRAAKDPGAANDLAWLCSVGTSGIAPLGDVVAKARLAAEDRRIRGIALNTLGAALYRDGHLGEAVDRINEGITLRGDSGYPQDWAFLAMAHARLGHFSDALRNCSLFVA